MSKKPKESKSRGLAKSGPPTDALQADFEPVLRLIDASRLRAVAAVNSNRSRVGG